MTVRQPHPIEVRSYEILRSRVDLSPMPPLWRAVAERVIHATADLEYAVDLVTTEDFLVQGWSALRAGAPIVTDEHMTAAGISARETACHADDPAAARMARAAGITRPAAAVRIAYSEVGPGAVWVVGSAPEAIFEIIARRVRPALVVGTPVGFVGAAEAKEAGAKKAADTKAAPQPEYAATWPDGRPMTFADAKELRLHEQLARIHAGAPRSIFTLNTHTGEIKVIHQETEWMNHLQFSPTDPQLIMFCHEGPWHEVTRLWTIRTDGTGLTKIHTRTMNMEIWGHEFFGGDGKTIWYDLQRPRGEVFWLGGYELATGRRTWYALDRNEWSVHFNVSPDGTMFAGDGGDSEMVAHAPDGKWIYLFRPRGVPDVAGIKAPNAEGLIHPGRFVAEKLVNMSRHDYRLEPNVTFTPDQKWIVFRSNMSGATQVYAVEIAKAK